MCNFGGYVFLYRFLKMFCICCVCCICCDNLSFASAMYSGNPFCCDKKYLSDGEKVILDYAARDLSSGTVSGAVSGALTGGVAGGPTGAAVGALMGATNGAVAGWITGSLKGLSKASGGNGECIIC